MTNFTPWSAMLGGVLIGLSASMLLLLTGRIAGISGIVGGLLRPMSGEAVWRAWFLAGLIAGGLALSVLHPASLGATPVPIGLAIAGGLFVGFGTRLGHGCTSGHGVCGLSRLSVRSLVATFTFMATGALSTYIVRHIVYGGQP
ncbi:YeeE/YedE family protein [Pendulispora brunnea]|uniref:YeeE/YedE family protein n=1 Tax=Pendulispora brunnea TaxID=2905690 RepID=A0ABZ2KH74_9BACT